MTKIGVLHYHELGYYWFSVSAEAVKLANVS